MTKLTGLADRSVIEIAGDDRVTFLQGIVSNDVAEAAPGRAVWTALLSAQGKWLTDFFVFADGPRLLLDVERAHAPMLMQKFTRHRLRAKVSFAEPADLAVYVGWDGTPALPDGAASAPDPRLPEAGTRIIVPATLTATADPAEWDHHRLTLGLPDGSRDMEPDKSLLLEAGFDELHGVSWTKGCYMGQELTARTRYRGLIKRRLVPVAIDGPLPAPGTPVTRDGAEVGTMRSGRGDVGLATLRLEALESPLSCGEARLTPRLPVWFALPKAPEPRVPPTAGAAAQAVT